MSHGSVTVIFNTLTQVAHFNLPPGMRILPVIAGGVFDLVNAKKEKKELKLASEAKGAVDFLAGHYQRIVDTYNGLRDLPSVTEQQFTALINSIDGLKDHINGGRQGCSLFDLEKKKKDGLKKSIYNDAKDYYNTVNSALDSMKTNLNAAVSTLRQLKEKVDPVIMGPKL
jgi:hypothetical protein